MTLAEFCEIYVDSRDISPGYVDQLRLFARACDRVGITQLDQLTTPEINRALNHWKDQKLTAETRRSRRRMFMTLADHAAMAEIIPPINRRMVQKIRAPRRIISTWSITAVRQLLAEAGKLEGEFYANGIEQSSYWESYIRAAWDTGLRGCDLRRIHRDDIGPDGTGAITQAKTGKVIVFALRPETLAVIEKTFPPERELIWPRWARLEAWHVAARKLVRRSGIGGSIGRLRHSCGTAVEVEFPGRGHERLGNTRQVFERHYMDTHKAGFATAKLWPPAL